MQWYIKEFSSLTKISIRMLRHYDKMGLLIPSVRLSNGYRLYSDKDLLKLQQITVLKHFGFSITQMKNFNADDLHNLLWQKSILQIKQKEIITALKTLDSVIKSLKQQL